MEGMIVYQTNQLMLEVHMSTCESACVLKYYLAYRPAMHWSWRCFTKLMASMLFLIVIIDNHRLRSNFAKIEVYHYTYWTARPTHRPALSRGSGLCRLFADKTERGQLNVIRSDTVEDVYHNRREMYSNLGHRIDLPMISAIDTNLESENESRMPLTQKIPQLTRKIMLVLTLHALLVCSRCLRRTKKKINHY